MQPPRAAGTKTSQGTLKISSRRICWPCAYLESASPRCMWRSSLGTSMPVGESSSTQPVASDAATMIPPRSASRRAVHAPTFPKPCAAAPLKPRFPKVCLPGAATTEQMQKRQENEHLDHELLALDSVIVRAILVGRQEVANAQHGAAASSRLAAMTAMQPDRLACDNAWRETLELGVLVKEPSHVSAVCVHVGRGNILVGPHYLSDLLHQKRSRARSHADAHGAQHVHPTPVTCSPACLTLHKHTS